MRRRLLGHRQPVDQMRPQHLPLDLHVVLGHEEPEAVVNNEAWKASALG